MQVMQGRLLQPNAEKRDKEMGKGSFGGLEGAAQ
jgi:hypothetical protein